MDTREYCMNLGAELSNWRSKIDHVARKLDGAETGFKEKVVNEIGELHIIMEELDLRIEGLKTACATNWNYEVKDDHEVVWPLTSGTVSSVTQSDFGG